MIVFGAVTDLLAPSKQEKEALDDLSTELELSDEDQPVLCVNRLHKPLQDFNFSTDTRSARLSSTCHIRRQ